MRFKFKAEKCTITEGLEKTLSSGDSYCITLNTENAGNGAVTCRIKSVNGRYVEWCKLEHSCYNKLYFTFSDLDINIVDNGDGTVSIYYTVEDAGEYTINVKFGGQTVPGGFYTFMVSVHLLQYKKKFCNEALQFNATMFSFVLFSKCTRMTSQKLHCCHNVDCRE